MGKVLVTDTLLTDIGDAIRAATGTSSTYTLAQMPNAIASISGGSSSPSPWSVLYENTGTIVSDNPNYLVINNFFSGESDIINETDVWRITWNGTPFICTTTYGPYGYFFGNPAVGGGPDDGSGATFIAYKRTNTQLCFVTTDNPGSITLKIEELVGELETETYTNIYSGEVTANTSSTTAESLTTINLGSTAVTDDTLLYIKIRDKAGVRANYFWGADSFLSNFRAANNSSTGATNFSTTCYLYTTYWSAVAGNYGVYPYQLSNTGTLTLYQRYNSTYTGTINGTYTIDVYLLKWPNNTSPYS